MLHNALLIKDCGLIDKSLPQQGRNQRSSTTKNAKFYTKVTKNLTEKRSFLKKTFTSRRLTKGHENMHFRIIP